MGVYPLVRRGRVISLVCLVLGGGMLLWWLLGELTEKGKLLVYGIGLLFTGVFTQTMQLRVEGNAFFVRALGIGRGVRFADITKMRLYPKLLSRNKSLALVITFTRNGRERKRTIDNINQYEDYEQFIREVEMFSGKKVEKV